MKPNKKAENQISGLRLGLRETVVALEGIGEDDCTHREWKEKEAILKRLRAALKALEPPASIGSDQNAAIDAIRHHLTDRAERSKRLFQEARRAAVVEALRPEKPH